jgi:hypothetical protein
LKHGSVRRSKLYYLRDRVGKAALYVRPGKGVVVTEEGEKPTEAEMEPVVSETETEAVEASE